MRAKCLIPIAVAMLTACTHREIVWPDGTPVQVHVAVEWQNAPQAMPEGMSVVFYPLDGGRIWQFEIPGRDGGTVEIPPGDYAMVTANNDQAGLTLRPGDAPAEFVAQCRAVSDADGNWRPFGMLYGAYVPRVTVTRCGIDYDRPDGTCKECPYGLLRCAPDSVAVQCDVVVGGIPDDYPLRQVSVTLDNLPQNMEIVSGNASGPESATVAALLRDGNLFSGSATVFDLPENVSLTIAGTDGKAWNQTLAPSQYTLNHLSAHHVLIYIRPTDLPPVAPPSADIELGVEVDGWTVIETDIIQDISY